MAFCMTEDTPCTFPSQVFPRYRPPNIHSLFLFSFLGVYACSWLCGCMNDPFSKMTDNMTT